ncbi:MAG: hypothetical protein V1743_06945 [Nanoarchaeota archaeon]
MSTEPQPDAGHDLAELFIGYLRTELKLSESEIAGLLKRKGEKETQEVVTIPTTVFSKELSSLETIVKYLKENRNLKVKEISGLLNRDVQTIYTTLRQAAKKHPDRFWKDTLAPEKKAYAIPIAILASREYAVLESIIIHLKTAYNLSFAEIATLLKRKPNTIWTTYNRVMQKKNERAKNEERQERTKAEKRPEDKDTGKENSAAGRQPNRKIY